MSKYRFRGPTIADGVYNNDLNSVVFNDPYNPSWIEYQNWASIPGNVTDPYKSDQDHLLDAIAVKRNEIIAKREEALDDIPCELFDGKEVSLTRAYIDLLSFSFLARLDAENVQAWTPRDWIFKDNTSHTFETSADAAAFVQWAVNKYDQIRAHYMSHMKAVTDLTSIEDVRAYVVS